MYGHYRWDAASLRLVQYRWRNQRKQVIDMNKIGSLRVEQPGELTPRRNIVDACEESANLPQFIVIEFRTVSEKRDNSVTVACEGVAQAVYSDFLSAELAISIMDQTNFHPFKLVR